MHNLFTFLSEEGKTSKSASHENENLATYFGIFDKNQLTKIPCCPSMKDCPETCQKPPRPVYVTKTYRKPAGNWRFLDNPSLTDHTVCNEPGVNWKCRLLGRLTIMCMINYDFIM